MIPKNSGNGLLTANSRRFLSAVTILLAGGGVVAAQSPRYTVLSTMHGNRSAHTQLIQAPNGQVGVVAEDGEMVTSPLGVSPDNHRLVTSAADSADRTQRSAPGELLWDVTYSDVTSLESVADAGNGTIVHVSHDGSTVILRWVDDSGALLDTVTFLGTGAVDIAKTIEYPGGGFVLTGETGETVSGTGDVWAVRVDAAGAVVWEREWNVGGDDSGLGLVVDGSGNTVVTGYVDDALLDAQAFLWKLSPAGDTLLQETYGESGAEIGQDVLITSDGGFLLMGRSDSSGAGGYDGWVLKADAAGVVDWDETYGTAEYDFFSDGLEVDDGLVLLGRSGPYGDASAWMVKTDSSGVIQWDETYGGEGWNSFNEIRLASDGRYAFCGFYQGAHPNWRMWIGEIETTGAMAWDASFGFTGFFETATAIDFREVAGGGYVVAGQGAGTGWLLRVFDEAFDQIFVDGFESGDTSGWSDANPSLLLPRN